MGCKNKGRGKQRSIHHQHHPKLPQVAMTSSCLENIRLEIDPTILIFTAFRSETLPLVTTSGNLQTNIPPLPTHHRPERP